MHQYAGTLIMHVGPMFGGKTTALNESAKKFKLAGYKVQAFKPTIDDRYSTKDFIVTHDGDKIPCIRIDNMKDLLYHVNVINPDVIAIDELQFIEDNNTVETILSFLENGKTVVLAGLDLTYDLKPFKTVQELMPYATYLTKHKAVCAKCGKDASTSFRKNNNKEKINIGGKKDYEPRCLNCYFKGVNINGTSVS